MDKLRVLDVKKSGFCLSEQHIRHGLSFDDIYRQHFNYVLTNARRLRFRSGNVDIDDVVQDVFVVVYRRIEVAQRCHCIRSWLLQVLHNVIRGYRRSCFRRYRRRSLAEIAYDKNTPMRDTERLVMRRQAMKALQLVPVSQRKIYVLYHIHGMKGSEIAKFLSMNVHTVRSRIHAAQRQLRQLSPNLNS